MTADTTLAIRLLIVSVLTAAVLATEPGPLRILLALALILAIIANRSPW